MAVGFFLCFVYLTAGVEIVDFRFCGRANVVVTGADSYRNRTGGGQQVACFISLVSLLLWR